MDEQNKASIQENIASVNFMRKRIILKGVALVGTLGLLVVLAVVGTVGWYTKFSTVDAITMDVAQFDFTANFVYETFLVNTADYTNINDYKVAPGSRGVIPIRLSTENSDVDVEYELTIDTSATAPEMKRRIRYFFFKKGETGTSLSNETTLSSEHKIQGTLPAGTQITEYVYWEWVYDLSKGMYYDLDDSTWKSTTVDRTFLWDVIDMENIDYDSTWDLYNRTNVSDPTLSAAAITARDDFDELDTRIGLGKLDDVFWSYDDGINRTGTTTGQSGRSTDGDPSEYKLNTTTTLTAISTGTVVTTTYTAIQQAMQATIKIKGVQAKPTTATPTGITTDGATRYVDPRLITN